MTTQQPPQSNGSALDLKFEAAVNELETLVRDMEVGSALDLEASIAAYQRGVALLKHCQAQLADAEERIRVLAPANPDGNTA